jgi:putative nucleotidyltransferase with HDIG domain
MNARVRLYVAAIILVTLGVTAFLVFWGPATQQYRFSDLLLLAGLALVGESLSVLLPRSAEGSMGFIPYFALPLVIPGWQAVGAAAIVRGVVEIFGKRAPVKKIFNIAAYVLMEAVAVVVFLGLGGRSLLSFAEITSVARVTREVGAAALLATAAGLVTNNLVVIGAIALSHKQSMNQVWSQNHKPTVGIDILATPLVFVFAWVYAAFGVIVTATLWIPILGLRQLHRTKVQLEQSNQELLELMVKSLEARDPYTSGHSRRVHHYSMIIARAIGLDERTVSEVGQAALLHDVGKIHEKYAKVLSKTEKLTPEEWALIQEHSNDGADLVATMSHLRDIVPAIRHHHENWDGTGYPDRIAGEMIPIASRIIRFADTIDAMTTERPYRGPLTEPEVRAEVVRCRGTQFDPMIADRLLSSSLWPSVFASTAIPSEPRARFAIVKSALAGGRNVAARSAGA